VGRRDGHRETVLLAVTLAVLAIVWAWAQQGVLRLARGAVVSAASPGVVLQGGAASTPVAATPGVRLREGTDVCAAQGAATLALFDGSTLELDVAAEARLSELRSGPLGAPCEVAIEQRHGRVTYHATPGCRGRSYFRVHVPGARLAGRGARFVVAIDAAGNTRIEVREGALQVVGAGGGQVVAQAGDTVRVVEGIVSLPLVPRPPLGMGSRGRSGVYGPVVGTG
jgi:hypothetical protein